MSYRCPWPEPAGAYPPLPRRPRPRCGQPEAEARLVTKKQEKARWISNGPFLIVRPLPYATLTFTMLALPFSLMGIEPVLMNKSPPSRWPVVVST